MHICLYDYSFTNKNLYFFSCLSLYLDLILSLPLSVLVSVPDCTIINFPFLQSVFTSLVCLNMLSGVTFLFFLSNLFSFGCFCCCCFFLYVQLPKWRINLFKPFIKIKLHTCVCMRVCLNKCDLSK